MSLFASLPLPCKTLFPASASVSAGATPSSVISPGPISRRSPAAFSVTLARAAL